MTEFTTEHGKKSKPTTKFFETSKVHMYFFVHRPDAWEVTILFLEEEKDFRIDLKSKKKSVDC